MNDCISVPSCTESALELERALAFELERRCLAASDSTGISPANQWKSEYAISKDMVDDMVKVVGL